MAWFAPVVLKTAAAPDMKGNSPSRDALQKLAEKFPDKLQLIGNELISKIEFDDDEHKRRMLASIEYHLTQQETNEKHQWCIDVLSPKCTARTVEETKHGYKLFVWHPQWGGYSSHAEVDFEKTTGGNDASPGCFELAVYHAGDFPTDEPVFHRHCCSAEQFVRFGLDVLEAQLQHQTDDKGELVRLGGMGVAQLEVFRDRISKLLAHEQNRR